MILIRKNKRPHLLSHICLSPLQLFVLIIFSSKRVLIYNLLSPNRTSLKMSSSASSRANIQKPKNVKPATDPLLEELGYNEYLFKQVATWETPLMYKGGYETGSQNIFVSIEDLSQHLLAVVALNIVTLGIGTIWSTQKRLSRNHEVQMSNNTNLHYENSFRHLLHGENLLTLPEEVTLFSLHNLEKVTLFKGQLF